MLAPFSRKNEAQNPAFSHEQALKIIPDLPYPAKEVILRRMASNYKYFFNCKSLELSRNFG